MSVIVSEIPEFRVKFRDIFHLKNLYVMMHEYLVEEGFLDEDQTQRTLEGHKYVEIFYMEKFMQPRVAMRHGREVWIWWRTIKQPETKYSGYFRYKLDFDIHVNYLRDIEVMHQGKKMRANWGEIEIFIRPAVEADYRGTWENHWFFRHFLKLYNTRILSQEFDKREKELWREAYRFQGRVKQFLNMRNFIPIPEPFWHPMYGYEEDPRFQPPSGVAAPF